MMGLTCTLFLVFWLLYLVKQRCCMMKTEEELELEKKE